MEKSDSLPFNVVERLQSRLNELFPDEGPSEGPSYETGELQHKIYQLAGNIIDISDELHSLNVKYNPDLNHQVLDLVERVENLLLPEEGEILVRNALSIIDEVREDLLDTTSSSEETVYEAGETGSPRQEAEKLSPPHKKLKKSLPETPKRKTEVSQENFLSKKRKTAGKGKPFALQEEEELETVLDVQPITEEESEKIKSRIETGAVFVKVEKEGLADELGNALNTFLSDLALSEYDYSTSMEQLFEIYAREKDIDKESFKQLLSDEPSLRFKKWIKSNLYQVLYENLLKKIQNYKGKDKDLLSLKSEIKKIGIDHDDLIGKIKNYKGKDKYFKNVKNLLNNFDKYKEIKSKLLEKLEPMSPEELWQFGISYDIPAEEMGFKDESLISEYNQVKSEIREELRTAVYEQFQNSLSDIVNSQVEKKYPVDIRPELFVKIKESFSKQKFTINEIGTPDDLKKFMETDKESEYEEFCKYFLENFQEILTPEKINSFLIGIDNLYSDYILPRKIELSLSICSRKLKACNRKEGKLNTSSKKIREQIFDESEKEFKKILSENFEDSEHVNEILSDLKKSNSKNKIDDFVGLLKYYKEDCNNLEDLKKSLSLISNKVIESIEDNEDAIKMKQEFDINKEEKAQWENYQGEMNEVSNGLKEKYERGREDHKELLENREKRKEILNQKKTIQKDKDKLGSEIRKLRNKLKQLELKEYKRKPNEDEIESRFNEKIKELEENYKIDEEYETLNDNIEKLIKAEGDFHNLRKQEIANQKILDTIDSAKSGIEKTAEELIMEKIEKLILSQFSEEIETDHKKNKLEYKSKVARSLKRLNEHKETIMDLLFERISIAKDEKIAFHLYLIEKTGYATTSEKEQAKKFRHNISDTINDMITPLIQDNRKKCLLEITKTLPELSIESFQRGDTESKPFAHWFVQETKQHIYQRFLKLPMIYADFTNSLMTLRDKLNDRDEERKLGDDLFKIGVNIITDNISHNEMLPPGTTKRYRKYTGKSPIKKHTNVEERSKMMRKHSFTLHKEIRGLTRGEHYLKWDQAHTFPAPVILSAYKHEINAAIIDVLGLEKSKDLEAKLMQVALKTKYISKKTFQTVITQRNLDKGGQIGEQIFKDLQMVLKELKAEGESDVKDSIVISMALNGLIHFYLRTLSETEYVPAYV
ncbi:MAG: hypothetical protein K940chlam3_00288, partial [Chlamydiae bacterium]|nr:hypothetical protein [Chlamydiota bacterium]